MLTQPGLKIALDASFQGFTKASLLHGRVTGQLYLRVREGLSFLGGQGLALWKSVREPDSICMVPNERYSNSSSGALWIDFHRLVTGLGTVGVGGGTEASCVRATRGSKAWGLISAEQMVGFLEPFCGRCGWWVLSC